MPARYSMSREMDITHTPIRSHDLEVSLSMWNVNMKWYGHIRAVEFLFISLPIL